MPDWHHAPVHRVHANHRVAGSEADNAGHVIAFVSEDHHRPLANLPGQHPAQFLDLQFPVFFYIGNHQTDFVDVGSGHGHMFGFAVAFYSHQYVAGVIQFRFISEFFGIFHDLGCHQLFAASG